MNGSKVAVAGGQCVGGSHRADVREANGVQVIHGAGHSEAFRCYFKHKGTLLEGFKPHSKIA